MKTLSANVFALVTLLLSTAVVIAAPLQPWDKIINGKARFKVLNQFNGEAVLDKETGLVWEQAPDSESDPGDRKSWADAQAHCITRTVGGRKGWRLPTIEELASLVDPNKPGGNPALPLDHPFSNVGLSVYWSTTTSAHDVANAWGVTLDSGLIGVFQKGVLTFAWCVRTGESGPDTQ